MELIADHTGLQGRHYDIIHYGHTETMDIHFRLNDTDYIIPVSKSELSELTYDFAQIVMKLA